MRKLRLGIYNVVGAVLLASSFFTITCAATAQQVNVGGTIAGGISSGDASGKAGGGQNSTAYGKATAKIGGNTRH